MKKLLVLALVAVVASLAVAQENDEFGLWIMDGTGEYVNSLTEITPYAPFNMYLTLHNPSLDSIGGYEAAIGLPVGLANVYSVDIQGGTNFGTGINHLVGYPAPLPMDGELFVLCTLSVGVTDPTLVANVELGPSVPSSVGDMGPAYANGNNADELITCGYITGMPHVFTFGGQGPVATEAHSLSSVKALFN